ncbi:MAG: HEAT repeat domain-containing protein [Vicinamibacterales bacterium]
MCGSRVGVLLMLLFSAPLQTEGPRGARELIAHLSAPDPEVRTRAACGLREIGDDAAPALDALVALLSDGAPVEQSACGRRWSRWHADNRTSPGEQAAAALVSIGTRAVQPLLRSLESSSWIARRNSAWALGALDDRRGGAPLVKAMADPEPGVRQQAAWALGALDEPAAVPSLVAALKDESSGVRSQAAWALGAIGDSRALNALLPALKDPDPGVRRQAAWAIGVLSR